MPGLLAAGLIAFLVAEKKRIPVRHISFGNRLRMLSASYRRFLVAVGLFGAGDFAHTLLILHASQKLTPMLGATKAASIAIALYVLHNIFYAAFVFLAGWLADRFPKSLVLSTGYTLAAVMAVLIIALPASVWMLGAVFVLGGVYVGIEETLEDSLWQSSLMRRTTAWPSACWRRSTVLAIFSPVQSSANFGPWQA